MSGQDPCVGNVGSQPNEKTGNDNFDNQMPRDPQCDEPLPERIKRAIDKAEDDGKVGGKSQSQ